jgi:hypothetical protein
MVFAHYSLLFLILLFAFIWRHISKEAKRTAELETKSRQHTEAILPTLEKQEVPVIAKAGEETGATVVRRTDKQCNGYTYIVTHFSDGTTAIEYITQTKTTTDVY